MQIALGDKLKVESSFPVMSGSIFEIKLHVQYLFMECKYIHIYMCKLHNLVIQDVFCIEEIHEIFFLAVAPAKLIQGHFN